MLILGIETALSQVGVAIGDASGVIASAHSSKDRRHAENLTPQIEFVCVQAHVAVRDIECVAVDIGPGLYTGLRVGLASAMAVAHGLDVPMIGVSSLDLGAHAVSHVTRSIVPCYDARRGEVFWSRYVSTPNGVQAVDEPHVSTPGELAEALRSHGEPTLLVGDGGEKYADAFAGVDHVALAGPAYANPSARSLVEAARPIAERGEFVAYTELKPLYLRLPDAEINWKTRDSA